MRNHARIKPFLNKFEEIWLKHPDLRFGQLIEILGHDIKSTRIQDLFYVEDEEFEKQMKEKFASDP